MSVDEFARQTLTNPNLWPHIIMGTPVLDESRGYSRGSSAMRKANTNRQTPILTTRKGKNYNPMGLELGDSIHDYSLPELHSKSSRNQNTEGNVSATNKRRLTPIISKGNKTPEFISAAISPAEKSGQPIVINNNYNNYINILM